MPLVHQGSRPERLGANDHEHRYETKREMDAVCRRKNHKGQGCIKTA